MTTLCALLAVALAGVAAWAFFSGTGQGTALATAATLDPPAGTQANNVVGFKSVSVTWNATMLSNGIAVDGYYLTRTNIASGATNAACGTSPSSLTTGTSCTDANVPDGTYTYAVVAVFRTWTATATSPPVSVSADTTAPSIAFTFPVDNGKYRNSSWTAGCNVPPFGAANTMCGTAQDSGANSTGVDHVTVSIQRGSTSLYWDGSGFASASEVKVPAVGTVTWTLSFAAANFPADGTYMVRSYATDRAGNTGNATAGILIDNTAPTLSSVIAAVSGTGPVGFVKQGGGYRVYANASDGGSGVDAGSLTADMSAVTAGSTSVGLSASGCPCVVGGTSYAYRSGLLTASSPLAEGAKSYSVSGADAVGNSASQSGSVTVDNTAPTLSSVIAATTGTGPVGFVKQGGGYRVYANVSDSGSGVDSGSLAADVSAITSGSTGVALSTSGCPCVVGGTSYAYRSAQLTASSPLGEGAKSYSLSGADTVGNTGSQSGSVTVDNTAPTLTTVIAATTGTGPVGFVKQGGGYRVYANASDSGSGVNAASLSADVSAITSGSTAVALTTSGCPCTIAGTSYAYQSSTLTAGNPLSEGAKTYTLTGADNLANTGSRSGSVTVDNTAPTLTTVVAATSGTGPVGFVKQGGGYKVYANASDSGSGVNSASLSVDVSAITSGSTAVAVSTTGCPCVVGGTSYAYQSATLTAANPLGEGAKSYTLSGADSVGNSGSQSGSVTVDDTAPTLATAIAATSGTGPVGFVKQGGGYRVYANASDGSSGVDSGSLAADVSAITSGSSSAALSTSGCPCVVGGTTYAYRSGSLTASSPLGEGAKSYSVSGSDNVGNGGSVSGSVTADNTAPTLTTAIAATSGTGPVGYVKQGGGYKVYANAADSGSGVNAASLTVDASAITSGSTSVALTTSGCPCTIAGTSYAYQSTTLTAANPLGEGAKSYTLSGADNVGNSGSASGSVTVDNTAPTLTTVIADATTNAAGFVHQGGNYFVYANATDAGSGVDTTSLTANVGSITTAGTALALSTSGGPWAIDGTSYAYRSAQQTAKNPLAAGSVSYTAAGADSLANSGTTSFSVTVDNTAPSPSNTTLANGGILGTADAGDTITIVFTEKIASDTFCSTWTNNTVNQTLSASDVVVTLTNNASNDRITVTGGATCTFHLGTIATGGNYVLATATYAGSGAAGSGANSSLAWNPSTRTLTITLGKQQSGTVSIVLANHTPSYSADGALQDLAGNGITTAAVNGTSSQF